VALSGIFTVNYALQLACCTVTLLAALVLVRLGDRWFRCRISLCGLALASGLWWLGGVVHDLRRPRNEQTGAVQLASDPTQVLAENAPAHLRKLFPSSNVQ
jgi:hypothetical protein